MWKYQGFKTKQEALDFKKDHKADRVAVCYKKDEHGHSMDRSDYELCVALGGLDEKEYPYCALWRV